MNELEILNCEQGGAEWLAARCGIATMSELKSIMAKGQGLTRRKYLLTVAGERIAGKPFDRYKNSDMERGHLLEDEARQLYMLMTDNEVHQVGFMKRGFVGYSPDSLISTDGCIEIKTKMYHLHIECLLTNDVPSENRQQLMGGLYVSGRQWIDFVSYSPGLPLFVKRVFRDEAMIAKIKIEVNDFLDEVAQTVEKINQYQRT